MEIFWEEKWWWDKLNGKCHISEWKIFETQREYEPDLGNTWRWKVYFQSEIIFKMFVFTLFSCSFCCFSFFKQASIDRANSPEEGICGKGSLLQGHDELSGAIAD